MATLDERLDKALRAVTESKDPMARLDAARQVRERAESMEANLVRVARDQGVSWTRIGELYGMSKQGAQQRFRRSRTADGSGH